MVEVLTTGVWRRGVLNRPESSRRVRRSSRAEPANGGLGSPRAEAPPLFTLCVSPLSGSQRKLMTPKRHTDVVPTFDDLLAQLLEEPEEVLGILSDVVNRGRLHADDLPPETLAILAKYDLVAFLVQRQPKRGVRSWVYPTPLGLKTYAILEREADRQEAEKRPRPRARRGRNDSGVRR